MLGGRGNDAQRKRIAIYAPSLRGGGVERVMVTLANGFASDGFPVDLVLANAEGPYIKDVAAEVNVVDLQSRSVIVSMPALIRYLRRQRPEAMLSAMNHANVVAVWARRLAAVKTRLVVSQRHTLTASMDNVRFQRERLVSWLMRYSYNRADGVIAISCGVADDLAAELTP